MTWNGNINYMAHYISTNIFNKLIYKIEIFIEIRPNSSLPSDLIPRTADFSRYIFVVFSRFSFPMQASDSS